VAGPIFCVVGNRRCFPAGDGAEGQEGKLFRPLAYTKNFAMVVAASPGPHTGPRATAVAGASRRILAGAGGRVQRALKSLLGGRIRSQEDHPITGRSCGGTSRLSAGPFVGNASNCWGTRLILLTIPMFLEARHGIYARMDEGSMGSARAAGGGAWAACGLPQARLRAL